MSRSLKYCFSLIAAGLCLLIPVPFAARTPRETPIEYVADCSGPIMFPQNGVALAQIDKYLASNYLFWQGIPYYDYPRGYEVSPYQVAYIGKLLLERYCNTKSPSDFQRAIKLRSWLLSQFAKKIDAHQVARIEYDFPNLPYTDKPGWGSAFAQSEVLDFAYRFTPSRPFDDTRIMSAATRAFMLDIAHDGLIRTSRTARSYGKK